MAYFDLEKEMEYGYMFDFSDIHHLSVKGAEKSTDFLAPYVLEFADK